MEGQYVPLLVARGTTPYRLSSFMEMQYVPLVVARETVHAITRFPLWKGNMCLCLLLWKLYN